MSYEEEELIYPDYELTDEMIEQIKSEIIPTLKRDGINSNIEYLNANENGEIDNVDLLQDTCLLMFPVDELLKINKNDYDDINEYYDARDIKWGETFEISEGQLIINLSMDYLEDNEW
jgi:hypothetical protein